MRQVNRALLQISGTPLPDAVHESSPTNTLLGWTIARLPTQFGGPTASRPLRSFELRDVRTPVPWQPSGVTGPVRVSAPLRLARPLRYRWRLPARVVGELACSCHPRDGVSRARGSSRSSARAGPSRRGQPASAAAERSRAVGSGRGVLRGCLAGSPPRWAAALPSRPRHGRRRHPAALKILSSALSGFGAHQPDRVMPAASPDGSRHARAGSQVCGRIPGSRSERRSRVPGRSGCSRPPGRSRGA
jgi:hypothetical protein